MEQLFNSYQKNILTLISLISSEDNSQGDISQEERKKVAEIENEYTKTALELQRIKKTIKSQYRSVRESCVSNTAMRIPEDQRPVFTNLSIRECIKIQEQIAKEIQEWFARKTQQAVAERQRKLQQEAARKQASALSAAEAERKRKEEAAALAEREGAALLEEMKRKYKNKF